MIVGDDADLVLMACVSCWVERLYVVNIALTEEKSMSSHMPVRTHTHNTVHAQLHTLMFFHVRVCVCVCWQDPRCQRRSLCVHVVKIAIDGKRESP